MNRPLLASFALVLFVLSFAPPLAVVAFALSPELYDLWLWTLPLGTLDGWQRAFDAATTLASDRPLLLLGLGWLVLHILATLWNPFEWVTRLWRRRSSETVRLLWSPLPSPRGPVKVLRR